MQEIVLTIRLSKQGLEVRGSTQDRMVLYGLMEMAKDTLRQQPPPSPIQLAGPETAKQLGVQ